MQFRFKEEHFLIIILFIAAVLRFYNLSEMSLMNDELSMLSRTHYSSFSELINKGIIPDVHPAGAQVFIFYWIKIFGDSVFAIRFPFALCGIFAVFMIYKIAALWINKTTGVFAAAALAILQFPLLYSQLIRMYSMGLFTTLVFTYCWTQLFIIKEKTVNSKWKLKLIYILAGAASMYLHYFALMVVGIVGITGLFFIRKADIKNYFILNILTVLLFLPHIKIFLSQLAQGGVGGPGGWLPTPDGNTFFEYFNNFFNDSWLYVVVLIIPVVCFILYRKQIKLNRFHLLAILFYIVPFLIGYIYSVMRNPVLQMPGMLFAFPYLLLFLFSFLPQQFNFKTALASVVFIGLLLYSTLIDKNYYGTYHFGEYKELADLTVKYNKGLGSKNITQVMNVQSPSYINYYFEKMHSPQQFALYRTVDDAGCAQLMQVASESKMPYFIYAFTNMANPPQARQVIQSYYPYLFFGKDMFNAGFYVYSKNKIENAQQEVNFYEFTNNFDKTSSPNDSAYMVTVNFPQTEHCADISTLEYSPGFEKKLSEMHYHKGTTVNASVKAFSPDTVTDSHLVLTIIKNDSAYVWLSATINKWIIEKSRWTGVYTSADIPKEFDGTETVKVFVWHRDKSHLMIDDLKITLTEATDYYKKGIRK
ncbi:MAG: glycosyltransferase family 39 protein [Bacteroidia bacterium]